MLKRGTLGLLLAAIALTGGVLLFENRSGSNSSQTSESSDSEATDKLFPIEEEDVEQVSVLRQVVDDSENGDSETEESDSSTETETLVFNKNEDGTWQMTEPEDAIAESGAIAFLLSQITSPTARSVTLEDPEADLAEFGLAEPDYTVSLTANDEDYTLKVGGLDFAGDSRYVQAIAGDIENSETASEASEDSAALSIYVVPGGILNAVQRPTAEWLIADDTDVENDNDTAGTAEEEASEPDAPASEAPEPEDANETLSEEPPAEEDADNEPEGAAPDEEAATPSETETP